MPASSESTSRSLQPPDRDLRSLIQRCPRSLLLLAGVVFLALSGNRAGISALGWIAPIPFIIAVTRLRGWRGRLVLAAACLLGAWLLAAKVVTHPVPIGFSLMFGIPSGAVLWLSLVAWDRLQRRLGPVWGIYLFACITVLADYAFFALSPAGDWGALLIDSQLDNLPLLQLASVGGIGLVTFVMAWPIAAVATMLVTDARRRVIPHLIAALSVLLVAQGWGALRLDTLEDGPTLRVAGVTVDLPDPMTSYDQLHGNVDLLFARSELAAQRGAQLVIWNEIATLVDPAEEPGLHARGAEFARAHHVDLVLVYGIAVSKSPISVDNKYEWFGPSGETLEVYRKHFIVPADPNLKGDAPLRVLERPWGKAAGAICYDYDSPALARAHARGGAGLVALPASDWRGIDPYHTLMARVRAIEGGMSIVRPTRAATSMAFDQYGRIRASMSAWEANDRVMLATVPTTHVDTLYTRLGDWPAAVALLFLGAALGVALQHRWHSAR